MLIIVLILMLIIMLIIVLILMNACILTGKSTTMRLITRMFDVTDGEVLVDGVNIRSVTTQSLRKRLAVVPQDNSLFDETVLYNIMYGNSNATASEISDVLEKCNLQETIAKLPNGVLTSVGERGARLSGGERQKVAIAR